MITLKVKHWLNAKEVREAVNAAIQNPLDKAAALIEADAKASMKAGGGASHTPSTRPDPPNVQTGTLRSSISWASIAGGRSRIIGPTTQAWYGRIHEFGGWYGKKGGGKAYFPRRAFMYPALKRIRDKFSSLFKGLDLKRFYRDPGPRGST